MPEPRPAPPRSGRARAFLRGLERSLAVSGVLFLIYHGAFDVSEVVSDSMAPTFTGQGAGRPDNDWLLTERVSVRFGAPPRFGVLAFRTRDGVQVAKRVVGYPGEALRVVDGALEVDGARLDAGDGAPPVHYLRAGHLRSRPDGPARHVVDAESVFVLGDNSQDSWDSRFFGDLPRERWRGRVVAVVWPPSRWRWLW